MIGLNFVYAVAGIVMVIYAALALRDRSNPKRFGNAAFWGLLAVSLLAGDHLEDVGNGILVIALVAIAAFGGLGRGPEPDTVAERAAAAHRNGDRLFLLALVIPVVALGGTLGFKWIPAIVDPKQVTLVSLTLGVLIALAAGYLWLRPPARQPLDDGRRLIESIGWAAILPQMLASLGAVFAAAGMGAVVGHLFSAVIPDGSLVAAVLVYALGMAGFTMMMGNAFAAFPVMAGAIGLPLLVHQYHGNPAVIAAIGMLAGFCGTLMTPLAANFNIVPAAILELKDRNAVIKAQVGTALPLLAVNCALIYLLAFR
ncbi:DUF979 domain-containing protein [Parablastomonas sp. CN1-191]|uniref:DUF979 domain-containing protein n=1 Tax=Parablastomonas sp. CN1-191 TaxID=3400908 RepID=UPI003BF882EB